MLSWRLKAAFERHQARTLFSGSLTLLRFGSTSTTQAPGLTQSHEASAARQGAVGDVMPSFHIGPPPGPSDPDLILQALFQSRLHDRSVYLGQLIQLERRRLSPGSHSRIGRRRDDDADLARIARAEQALAAVQAAEERMSHGDYGRCQGCRQPIDLDELLEAPEKTTCRQCNP